MFYRNETIRILSLDCSTGFKRVNAENIFLKSPLHRNSRCSKKLAIKFYIFKHFMLP